MAVEPTVGTVTKRRRIFYGWWLLAAGTGLMAIQGAFFGYGFNAFFLPLANTLGVSRGVLSMAFSLTRLENGLLGPIEGFLVDHFGPRKMMIVGVSFFGLGFFLFSLVDSLLEFYLVFPLIALGASMAGFLPMTATMNNWFSKWRGLAMGVSSAGVNLGGAGVALVALSITSMGWRGAAVVIALITWGIGFPLAAMMRRRPRDYGYLPDGAETAPVQETSVSGHAVESPDEDSGFTIKTALMTPAFWFINAAHGISLLTVTSVSIHEIPLLVDAGISYQTAATVLATMTFVAIFGRVAGGYLGDRIGKKQVLVASFLSMSVGILALATAQTVAQAMVFAVFYGLGYGARAPVFNALRGDYFRGSYFATIMGLGQPLMLLGSFFGPVIAGFAYDVQGSYRLVFTAYAVINLLGIVATLLIKRPAPPQRRNAPLSAR